MKTRFRQSRASLLQDDLVVEKLPIVAGHAGPSTRLIHQEWRIAAAMALLVALQAARSASSSGTKCNSVGISPGNSGSASAIRAHRSRSALMAAGGDLGYRFAIAD